MAVNQSVTQLRKLRLRRLNCANTTRAPNMCDWNKKSF